MIWKALTGILAVACMVLVWQNRSLDSELAEARTDVKTLEKQAGDMKVQSWATPRRDEDAADGMSGTIGKGPSLPATRRESRMARRARWTALMADVLGRSESESDADYKARVGPIIEAGLARPRQWAAKNRTEAEAAAGVSTVQSQELDKVLADAQKEVLDYANSAIVTGQLTPYERDLAGMLEVAGGMAPILKSAQAKIELVLKPEQMKAMYDSGFEWGEYLSMTAPWESIEPPPPRAR